MKKLLLSFLVVVSLALSVQAQQARRPDWKASLAQSLVQKFDYPVDVAQKLVSIKESYFNQIQYYRMPHIQGRMNKDEWNKAVAELYEKELKAISVLVKDEAIAKETAGFLEGKIPDGRGGPRPR